MDTTPLLALHDLAKRFGPTVALDGVELAVRAGEVHALIGENGAGKSTLLNILAGAFRPDRGTMTLGGARYAPANPVDARRAGIALIHQELSLCPHLSVTENILLGAEVAKGGVVDWKASHERARAVLAQFGRAEIRPERRVGELPVAARQVVEICRALAADARVVLMDEPTSSLQRDDAARLFALIRDLRARGIAVVYISHFLEEVREVADTFTVLRDGRSVSSGRLADVTDDAIIAQMVGRPISGLFPTRAPVPNDGGEPLLEVRGLVAPPVVREASFTLRRGEVLGVAGLMGSGRTEMVRALFGLAPATSGTVLLRGRALAVGGSAARPARRLRDGLGYLSEDRAGEGLALPMSIADNLTLTRPPRAKGTVMGVLDLRKQREQAERVMTALGVRAASPLQPVRALSGGNQQKVAVGRLVHQEADVLLLDEPTRGIDIGSKAQVYETIAECAAAGKAVLLVSSYLPELFGMCDRLAVMSRGRLSETRAIDAWTPETVLRAAIGDVPNDSTRTVPT